MNVTKFSKSRRSAVSAKRVVWTLMIQVHPSRAHTATAAFELALWSSVIAGTNTQIRLFIYHFVDSLCPSSFSKGKHYYYYNYMSHELSVNERKTDV